MRFEVTSHADNLEIRLKERMSFGDHARFREILSTIHKAAPKRCVFDMSELVSVDSAALGMLMIAHDQASKEGWSLALRAPQQQVKRILELACFDKILAIS